MSWIKVVCHDLRCGILRIRYLAAIFIFALPCVMCYMDASFLKTNATLVDYWMYCFMGIEPISLLDSIKEFKFPILWLLSVGGLLFLCFDYPLNDLTTSGQQVIYRCQSRRGWFLSKCVWNILSSMMYFSVGILTTCCFTVMFGGSLSLTNTPQITAFEFKSFEQITLQHRATFTAIVIAPFFALAAFNLMQMVMTFVVKPLYSFLMSMTLLMIAVYNPSGYVLGNGAMLIRSSRVVYDGVTPTDTIMVAVFVIIASTLIGMRVVDHFDILNLEE